MPTVVSFSAGPIIRPFGGIVHLVELGIDHGSAGDHGLANWRPRQERAWIVSAGVMLDLGSKPGPRLDTVGPIAGHRKVEHV